MSQWRVQLLGGLCVAGNGWSASAFPTRRAAMILARAALARTNSLGRDELAEFLWPEDLLDSTRVRLRQELKRLKAALGPASPILESDRTSVRLNLDLAEVDARIFQQSAKAALAAPADQDRVSMLRRAVDHYGGPLLPEFSDLWTFGVRLELRALFDQASGLLLQELTALEDWDNASALASKMAGINPLNQDAIAALMRAAMAKGDAAAGLAVHSGYIQARSKAGEPGSGEELAELARELRRAAKPQPAKAPPQEPRRAEASSEPPSLLPLPAYFDEFVGREDELRTTREMLLSPEAGRAVTLVGPGGVGKTRLSVEACRGLGGALGPHLFLAMEGRLGHDLTEAVNGCCPRSGPFVVVLDNCESDLEGAAGAAKVILAAHPEARILATSRQRLGIGEERVVRLSTLAAPVRCATLGDALDHDAIRLFVERAKRASSSFTPTDADVPDLVRLAGDLDGLPLALELAASRIGTVGLKSTVDQLDDRFSWLVSHRIDVPDRQRSLWAAIDWSWQALSTEEREALCVLAWPPGGASMGLAKALLDGPVNHLVGSLAERSLISGAVGSESGRIRVLDTVREFVKKQMPELEEAVLAERFGRWAVALLEAHDVQAHLPAPQAAHPFLFAEQENLQHAIQVSADSSPELALEIASRLGPFWIDLGRPREGLSVIRSLFGRELPATVSRARCEFFAGRMAALLEDLPLSAHWLARGSVTARLAGKEGLAQLCDLNQTVVDLDFLRLEACLEGTMASIAWYRESGEHKQILLVALCQAGVVHSMMGQFVKAAELHQEALDLAIDLGQPQLTSRVYRDMAYAAGEEGMLEESIGLFEEALALLEQSSSSTMEAWTRLMLLGRLVEGGHAEEARVQRGLIEGLITELPGPHAQAFFAINAGRLALTEHDLALAATHAKDALRIAVGAGRPSPMIGGIILAAESLCHAGAAARASSLCQGLRAAPGARLTPSTQRWLDQTLARAGMAEPAPPRPTLNSLAARVSADLAANQKRFSEVSRMSHDGQPRSRP